jgi:predicted amidophosphoribosyltransferase
MECPICLEPIPTTNEIKTDCNHYFCKTCLMKWQKKEEQNHQCPICRSPLKKYTGYISIPILQHNQNIIITRANSQYDPYIRELTARLARRLLCFVFLVAVIFTAVIIIFLI